MKKLNYLAATLAVLVGVSLLYARDVQRTVVKERTVVREQNFHHQPAFTHSQNLVDPHFRLRLNRLNSYGYFPVNTPANIVYSEPTVAYLNYAPIVAAPIVVQPPVQQVQQVQTVPVAPQPVQEVQPVQVIPQPPVYVTQPAYVATYPAFYQTYAPSYLVSGYNRPLFLNSYTRSFYHGYGHWHGRR